MPRKKVLRRSTPTGQENDKFVAPVFFRNDTLRPTPINNPQRAGLPRSAKCGAPRKTLIPWVSDIGVARTIGYGASAKPKRPETRWIRLDGFLVEMGFGVAG